MTFEKQIAEITAPFVSPLGVITELDANEVEQSYLKELLHIKKDARESIEREIIWLYQRLHELEAKHQRIYEKQISQKTGFSLAKRRVVTAV